MNTTKVQTLINELIAEVKNNRQYPTSKAQDAQLKELGIYDMMPMTQVKNGRRFIGYTDAAVIIEAATTGKTALMNAFGEGEEVPADALNAALNEKEVVTAETIAAAIEIDLSDDDFSNAEKAESINDAAVLAVRKLNIEDVDAKQQMIESVIDILATRYLVAV